jgi:serine/threonine-protein kinase
VTLAPEERYRRAQEIVHELMELPASKRAAYARDACGDDVELRREIDWLLAAIDDESSDPVPAVDVLARSLLADARVEAVAPRQYHLIERIGEGGMGQVWLAERDDGTTRQRVALKMLRGAGTPDERELARFLAEGRILAGLDHPNIARLLDAGRGVDGAPFLAMEHVEGERIDRWCNAHDANLRERIALFIKVCAAVEFAHARLVIHRDIKPANILVDAHGEPKLLDFGIARLADDAPGANATTVLRAMTLAYASPEQIEGKSLGTATDIYSLGVVLYELLAGARPFEHVDSEHARNSAVLSGDVEPPSRLARRQAATEPPRRVPVRRIPVDVDAIVLKALRREPGRRYASVADFAEDLRRYLAARPVLARRDVFGYRARRFAWRNRWPLAVAALLLAISTAFTWRTLQAEREARLQAATSDQVVDFLVSIFAASDSDKNDDARHDLSARDVLANGTARIEKELAGKPRIQARLLEAVGNAYRHMNDNPRAARLLRAAADLDLSPAVDQPLAAARNLEALANAMANGQFTTAEAEKAARDSLALAERLSPAGSQPIANAWMVLSLALNRSGNYASAHAAALKTLEMNERLPKNDENRSSAALNNLCLIMSNLGRLEEARAHCEHKLASMGDVRNLSRYLTLRAYAQVLQRSGELPAAIKAIDEGAAIAHEREGESGLFSADALQVGGTLLDAAGRYTEGRDRLERARAMHEQVSDKADGDYESVMRDLGRHYATVGEFERALPLLRDGLATARARFDAEDPRVLNAQASLAVALLDSGDAGDEAHTLLEQATQAWSRKDDAGSIHPALARVGLAEWFERHGDAVAARHWLDMLEIEGRTTEVPIRACALQVRARLARAANDIAAAHAFDESAWTLLRDRFGETHPLTLRAALRRAADLRERGDTNAADTLEHQVRPALERALPGDSVFLARP